MYPNRMLIHFPLQQDEEISTGNQHDPGLLLSWIFAVSKWRPCLTGLPWWGQRICLQCRRHRWHGFDPWVRKSLWRRKWQPTPVFLPGTPQGSHGGHKKSDMTEWLGPTPYNAEGQDTCLHSGRSVSQSPSQPSSSLTTDWEVLVRGWWDILRQVDALGRCSRSGEQEPSGTSPGDPLQPRADSRSPPTVHWVRASQTWPGPLPGEELI